MNILICSAGRRTKIVQYFKKALQSGNGQVIATDCDKNAPALYYADGFELIPRIDSADYLNSILSLCEKYNITAIISLIDPELEVLAENKSKFDDIDVKLILSPLETIQYTFDKQATYDYLSKLAIPAVPTYSILDEVEVLLNNQEMTFPLVVKPGKGSASIGIKIVASLNELKYIFSQEEDLIIQPFYKEREYGIDVYVDMIDGNLTDMFIKEKIKMRSGETDKSVSIYNEEIEMLVKDLITKSNFKGPIDIDCFLYEGKYYISEINPRFGGGYPHAYETGCDFMGYIVANLQGKTNHEYSGYQYEEGYVMMKYDDVVLVKQ